MNSNETSWNCSPSVSSIFVDSKATQSPHQTTLFPWDQPEMMPYSASRRHHPLWPARIRSRWQPLPHWLEGHRPLFVGPPSWPPWHTWVRLQKSRPSPQAFPGSSTDDFCRWKCFRQWCCQGATGHVQHFEKNLNGNSWLSYRSYCNIIRSLIAVTRPLSTQPIYVHSALPGLLFLHHPPGPWISCCDSDPPSFVFSLAQSTRSQLRKKKACIPLMPKKQPLNA